MTIFERLRADHDHQRALLKMLVDSEGDTEHRRKTFELVCEELAEHAAAEERFFYSELMHEDVTLLKARHSVAEHHELDELVEKMKETKFDSPNWLKLAKKLAHDVNHHVDEEEREVFPLSGKVLSETDKKNLGEQFHHFRAQLASDDKKAAALTA